MNEALVVFLVLLWAIVLLPGAIRSRRSSPRTTVGGFEHAMDVLAHRRHGQPGRQLLVPNDARRIVSGRSTRDDVLDRRRRVFTVLVGTSVVNLPLTLLVGGVFGWLELLSLVALGAYVALLLRLKRQRRAAVAVVRHLPEPEEPRWDADDPRFARVAAGGGAQVSALQVATHPDEPWQRGAGVRIRRWE